MNIKSGLSILAYIKSGTQLLKSLRPQEWDPGTDAKFLSLSCSWWSIIQTELFSMSYSMLQPSNSLYVPLSLVLKQFLSLSPQPAVTPATAAITPAAAATTCIMSITVSLRQQMANSN